MKNKQLIDNILGHVSWLVRREKEQELYSEEINSITYEEYKILAIISESEELTISQLASILKITNPSMTVRIQKMERIGLVYKEKSEKDRRYSYIKLTEKAKAVESAEERAFDKIDTFISEVLTKEEEAKFYDLLTKLNSKAIVIDRL